MNKQRKNIALFTFGIGNISGGGGAERFFSDLFEEYNESELRKYELFWILDKVSAENLNSVGKNLNYTKILKFQIFSNRFKYLIEKIQLLILILRYKIKVVHVPMYNLHFQPYIDFLTSLPKFLRPIVTINIVDCSLPYCFLDGSLPRHDGVVKTYTGLFNNSRVNGYLSWNENFVDFAKRNEVFRVPPYVYAIKSRFCKTKDFYPQEKENIVVFASRLAVFKNADWYLKAISVLYRKEPFILNNWDFLICGDGPYKSDLVRLSEELGLNDKVKFKVEPQLQKVLNHSRIFVSCQDFDNFPSMSMAEAMASGNIIVSRNVGQTGLFVRDGYNGFLSTSDTVEGVAMALRAAIIAANESDYMSQNSVMMMKNVHTVPAFIMQIDEFWETCLTKN